MRCRAVLGRLSAPVEVRSDEHHGLEMFVGPRIAEAMPLLDGHHGRPLAHLRSTSVLPDGTLLGEFVVRKGREAEVRSLLGKPLSIEFSHDSRDLEPDRFQGRSVMVYRGAVVRAVAALGPGEEPSRPDCHLEWVEAPAPELSVRSVRSADGPMPKAVRDRLEGRTIRQSYGGSIIRYG